MKIWIVILLLIVSQKPAYSQIDLPGLISESEKAVCLIETFDSNGNSLKLGTGFFIDDVGTCISNYHVFKDSKDVIITSIDNKKYKIQEIIKSSISLDLIVFKVDAKEKINYLKLIKTLPNKGESIITIGNPKGLNWSASEGIVASVRILSFGYILQITAPISNGNSGSPILNINGEAIGIATFIMNEGQNLNFALHIGILDSIKTNDAIFGNFNHSSALPSELNIAKIYLDSIVSAVKITSDKGIPDSKVLEYIDCFTKNYPKSSFGYIKKGDFYRNKWEFQKAYEFYSKAIQIEPNSPEPYLRRGLFIKIYYGPLSKNKMDVLKIAMNDFIKYGSFSKQNLLKSYTFLASCYKEINENNIAINYITKYINESIKIGNKDLYDSYIERAYLYWNINQFEKANSDFDNAIKISPTCFAKNSKARFLVENNKYYEASTILYDDCLQTYDDYYLKSLVLLKIDGDLNKARIFIKYAISTIEEYVSKGIKEKSETEKFYRLAALLFNKTEPLEELKYLHKILEVNPSLKNDYEFSIWLIDVKHLVKDYIGELKDINQLIEHNPQKAELFERKGWCLFSLYDNNGAVNAFSKAVEFEPKNGRYYRYRGMAKYYYNDKTGACIDWSKAGELGEYEAYDDIKQYCK